MPPTFAYIMCLSAYVALMVVGLAVCLPLLLIPAKRRLGLRLCSAILASLPGILICQVIVGCFLGLLLVLVHLAYFALDYANWARWVIGLPTIFIMFLTLAAASFYGCYTGAKIAWETVGGKPFRAALSELKISQLALSWFNNRKAQIIDS